MLWIPAGFGHAFLVLSDEAGFAYKVTDYYSPGGRTDDCVERSGPGDPWPVAAEDAIVSEKDQRGRRFKDAEVFG